MKHLLSFRGCLLLIVAVTSGCGENEDLTRAIDGGVGRAVEAPAVEPNAHAWTALGEAAAGNDTLLHLPRSMCWDGQELFVAEGGRQRIEVFDADGHPVRSMGSRGSGPGEFRRLSVLRCADGGGALLAADPGAMRVQVLGTDGSFRTNAEAAPTPQGNPFLGDFALAGDGSWYDSWFNAAVGPYLTGDAWRDVRLVRAWGPAGEARGEFGDPFVYRDPVLRRVFNRVGLALHRDTLWVLSQANAVVRGYASEREIPLQVFLPIYHRGSDPVIELGSGLGTGWRENRANYQPNVQGLAVVHDTLFATIRFRDWRTVTVARREGESYRDYWADSAVEIFDRSGRVLASLHVPGRATQLASNHADLLSVLTEDLDTGVTSVLLTRLPVVID
jgi:hypothetical protein